MQWAVPKFTWAVQWAVPKVRPGESLIYTQLSFSCRSVVYTATLREVKYGMNLFVLNGQLESNLFVNDSLIKIYWVVVKGHRRGISSGSIAEQNSVPNVLTKK